jgi:CheY-like chemotaxis protein
MIDDKFIGDMTIGQDSSNPADKRQFRVLAVDDEELMLTIIRRMISRGLSDKDVVVDSFTSPVAALEKLTLEQYAVVISDYCILDPETKTVKMFGDELLSKVKELQPLATRVMMSGSHVRDDGLFYPDGSATPSRIPHYAISKPFDNGELVYIVKKGIEDYLTRAK